MVTSSQLKRPSKEQERKNVGRGLHTNTVYSV